MRPQDKTREALTLAEGVMAKMKPTPEVTLALSKVRGVLGGFVEAKTAAEEWMRDWANRHLADKYDEYGEGWDEKARYERAIDFGYTMRVGSFEDARDYIDDEWWDNWQAITGHEGQRGGYFSCAC
jgi:hypothetical protein